jgi:hypothetical protein
MIGAVLGQYDSAVLVALFGVISLWIQLRTKRDTRQINNAVNHVGAGEPPLIQRVRDLEAHEQWEVDVLNLFATHLGVELPAHPKPKKKEH